VKRILAVALVLATWKAAGPLSAQTGMPDLRQMSGVPLPASDMPAGSVSVRVVRGSFADNVVGVPVTLVINGRGSDIQTDAAGRAEISGVAVGSRVKAFTVVDGERLETQEITIGQTGFRFILSTGTKAAAGAAPAVTGTVVFGPGSRIIAQLDDDQLFVFYVLSIVNGAASPVDIGGPLTVELPQGARGTTLVEDSSPQATASGPRVIVAGPFLPGTTRVNIRFELPYSGPTATIEQRWPAPLQQVQVFALKTGEMDLESPQLATKQSAMQEGLPIIVASGPGLGAGQALRLEITGLPYHAAWPRYVALALAGAIMSVGIWAAFPRSPRAGGRRHRQA
jgi:hypothetical protein